MKMYYGLSSHAHLGEKFKGGQLPRLVEERRDWYLAFVALFVQGVIEEEFLKYVATGETLSHLTSDIAAQRKPKSARSALSVLE